MFMFITICSTAFALKLLYTYIYIILVMIIYLQNIMVSIFALLIMIQSFHFFFCGISNIVLHHVLKLTNSFFTRLFFNTIQIKTLLH